MDTINVSSTKKYELIDITEQINKIVDNSQVKDGLCNVYTPHATAAILINENYDPNVMDDVISALDKIIPEGVWKHDAVDSNGAAHIKAAIIGPSENIPIKDGKLMLGRWQDIMMADFDGPRSNRAIHVHITKNG
jgi:secondary thiamine-phosphate synthase enzyme